MLLPFIWFNTAFDLGPVSIQMLLRTVMLYEIFRLIKDDERSLTKVFIISTFLIWGKLDSLFFLVVPVVFIIFRTYRLKTSGIKNISLALGTLVVYAMGFLFALKVSQSNTENLIVQIQNMFWNIIPSNIMYSIFNLVYPNQAPIHWLFVGRLLLFVIVLISFLSMVFFLRDQSKWKSPKNSFEFICSATNIMLLICLCTVSNATAPWHTHLLFPSAFLTLILFLAGKRSGAIRFIAHFLRILTCTLVALILSTNYVIMTPDKENINPLLSESTANLIDSEIALFNPSTTKAVAFTNWGEYNRIFMRMNFSDPNLAQLWDVWPWFNDRDNKRSSDFLNWVTTDGPWKGYQQVLLIQNSYGTPGASTEIFQIRNVPSWRVVQIREVRSGESDFMKFIVWERK
jgi:hypothetical protein